MSTTTHPPDVTPTERATVPAALAWMTLATFVVVLNETVLTNALPEMMRALEIDARTGQWLSTGYMLTMAAVIPTTGWLLQRFHTRTLLVAAMTVFCAGTMACALAPDFTVIVMGRVTQAAGGAIMVPLTMSALMQLVPAESRGRVMGLITMAIAVAPALGPTASGFVLALGSWRWTFAIVLPIAVLVTLAASRRLERTGARSSSRIDVPSVLLSAVGFGPLVYGLSRVGTGDGRTTAVVLLTGISSVALFVARQRRLLHDGTQLLDLRTLAHPQFRVGAALMFTVFMTVIGTTVVVPIYVQGVMGLSPLQSGLLVMPGGVAMGLLGPVVGRLFDRVGVRPLVVPGTVAILATLIALSRTGSTSSPFLVMGLHIAILVGCAFVLTPAFTTALGSLPASLYAHGSALLATTNQVAAATGTALVVTVLSWRTTVLVSSGHPDAAAGGIDAAFLAASGVAGVAVVLGLALARSVSRSARKDNDS